MTDIAFSENAWGEYLVWQSGDRKTLRRINKLIADMQRHPDTGLGKPERLKGDLAGVLQSAYRPGTSSGLPCKR
ncbi:Toxin RelK [Mobiluncus mulieris]|uniref:type II toxin-antitoxin system YoeB family toxin n=1 Tax=Mobiluncus mulieris TaxID=2052 RepID=UPI00019F8DA3|nr:type II toxin-antitoxin system YoeB family toxin [Mobiluncus mulieris]EEJ54693.1 putative addiction module toxin, Txe/YoeB family [Mobiluncus mulieris ATCC 35243]SPX76755.1 Toxin RelK [Mobiluncus mulieris]